MGGVHVSHFKNPPQENKFKAEVRIEPQHLQCKKTDCFSSLSLPESCDSVSFGMFSRVTLSLS